MIALRFEGTAAAAAVSLGLTTVLCLTIPHLASAADDVGPAVELKGFASPYLVELSTSSNITCYISNVGGAPVVVQNFGIRQLDGPRPIASTTCGNPRSFTLAPGKSCFIGAQPDGFVAGRYSSCSAQSANVGALRGSLESRNADGRVRAAILMTPGRTSAGAEQFATIASPNMFGGPGQTRAACTFLNVGKTIATIRNVRFVNSVDQEFPVSEVDCAFANGEPSPAGQIRINGLCQYRLDSVPVTDLQCRAQVTNKADIRGTLAIRDATVILNQLPLE